MKRGIPPGKKKKKKRRPPNKYAKMANQHHPLRTLPCAGIAAGAPPSCTPS
jgi:hypothetical protein